MLSGYCLSFHIGLSRAADFHLRVISTTVGRFVHLTNLLECGQMLLRGGLAKHSGHADDIAIKARLKKMPHGKSKMHFVRR